MAQDAPFKKGVFVPLPNRGLVVVSGPDRRDFLQALITNDIDLLIRQKVVYSCLLTAQGKIEFDFFVTQQGEKLILECEGGERARALYNRLHMFKLKSNVTIELAEKADVYLSFETNDAYLDPRHPQLGARHVGKIPAGKPVVDFDTFDAHRLIIGIPDGSRDIAIGKDTPHECNIDRQNGISFTKGCYIGQELTSRIQHRGLAKSHLITVFVKGDNPAPPPFTDIVVDGLVVGEMRSSRDGTGLAMIRDNRRDMLEAGGFKPFL